MYLPIYLQGGQDQENSEVDPDHHVNVVPVKHVGDMADDEEDEGRDEDSEDVADEGPPEHHEGHHAISVPHHTRADAVALDVKLNQLHGARVDEAQGVEGLLYVELEGTGLCVERIPWLCPCFPRDCRRWQGTIRSLPPR